MDEHEDQRVNHNVQITLQVSDNPLCIVDQTAEILAINSAATSLFDLPSAACLGENLLTLLQRRFQLEKLRSEEIFLHDNVDFDFEGCTYTLKSSVLTDDSGEPNQLLISINQEKPLQNAQEHLEDVIALLPGHVYWLDTDCRFIGCNEKQAQSAGLNHRSEIKGLTNAQLPWNKDAKDVADVLDKVNREIMETGIPQTLEEPGAMYPGQTYLSKKKAIYDHEGNLKGLIGISFDITERKKLQNELKETKEQLQRSLAEQQATEQTLHNLLEIMPGFIYWATPQGEILGCNNNVARIFDFDNPCDVAGKNLSELLDPVEAQRALSSNAEVIESLKPFSAQERLELNGQEKFLLTKKTPLINRQGECIGVISISFDISEIKAIEKKLAKDKHKAENSFENIISLLPGHVYWKDHHGVYLGCNDKHAEFAGLNSRFDIVGKTLEDLPWKIDTTTIANNDMKLLDGELELATEETEFEHNGETIYFLNKKAPLKDIDGKIIGVLGMAFDVTSERQAANELNLAKEKAEAANAAKSKFIANMSHDLRTPLHALLGMSEILQIHKHYPEQEDVINSIAQSGKTLLTLVEDILNFSKLDANQVTLNNKYFDLAELLKNTVSTISLQAKEKNIELALNYDDTIPSAISSDPDIFRRVLLNLLTNAVKFTSHGHIILSAEHVKTENNLVYIQFSVEDTGIGISEENLGHVFDRFYRANPSYEGKYKGTGLGLAIAQQLAGALGGELRANSKVGCGSTFYCTLPFETSEDRRSANEPTLSQEKFSSKVLLVEDDKLVQKVSSAILLELGCKVECVGSGKAALEKTAQNEYDLIFMDIGLPDLDGLEVTKLIRNAEQTDTRTPIFALTAHASEQDQQVCLAAGMDGFIVKPASYGDFQQVLKTITA